MPRTNAVLKHPQREEIHKQLLRNVPYRDISRRYGMNHASVYRYKQEFVDAIPAEVAVRADVQKAVDHVAETTIRRLSDSEVAQQRWDGLWDLYEAELAKEPENINVQLLREMRTYLMNEHEMTVKMYEARLKEHELKLKQAELSRAAGEQKPIKIEYELVGGLNGDN